MNVADDILIFGKTPEEHDEALERVLRRFVEPGLTLNRKKCEFYKPELEFFGMKFSGEGMASLTSRIQSL